MAILELFLLFVLGFEGIRGDQFYLYHKVGEDVDLPCVGSSLNSCSSVGWLYNDVIGGPTETKVENGNVKSNTGNAARLSVSINCSLIIMNVVPEDAGRYICRKKNMDNEVHLNILSISPSQPAGDALTVNNVTLRCSLWRYLEASCSDGSLFWTNDLGTKLVGENIINQQKTGELQKCVSSLTVKHPTSRYTCQFFEGDNMKLEAHYSPLHTGLSETFPIYIITAVVAAGIALLAFIVTLLIKCRRTTKQAEDQKSLDSDVKSPNPHIDLNEESPSSLTYISFRHLNPKSLHKVKGQEDVVTYSTVKPQMEIEVDSDQNGLYSCVHKPDKMT